MRIFLLVFFLLNFVYNSQAVEYFVEPILGNDAYAGSKESPWKSVNHAFSVIQPGDVLNLFTGTYQPMSGIPGGESGLPITIKSVDGDLAKITNPGINNGLLITNDYVIIDGLEIYSVKNNGINIQANYITVRNCIIHDTGLAVKANTSYVNHHILIEYCSFYNFSDIAIFPDAVEKMIIRNNILYNGASVMMDPGGVQELLIENNFVTNPKRKLGALKLRWGNIEDVSGPNCNGTIVRNNIFLEGDKYNILLASANGAMVYNNVMINNMLNGSLERGVVYMQKDPAEINPGNPLGPNQKNVLKNNIFQVNGGDSDSWMNNALVVVREDMAEDISTNEFDNNLYYKSSGSLYIVSGTEMILEGDVVGWGNQFDLYSIIGQDPELNVKDTLDSARDFMPVAGSPVIDRGAQLTVTDSSGTSDILFVRDSRYFYGGHGMISGDEIVIGNRDTATVIDRDIINNTLTLNKVVTFQKGDSVSLVYSGSAPDIGAYEEGIENEIGNAAGAEEMFKMINEDAKVSEISEYKGGPSGFNLAQNYPNPFNPTTTIKYNIQKPGDVKIVVYNVAGMVIKVLANEVQVDGDHRLYWNGTQMENQSVSSGVYFYQFFTDGYSQTKKNAFA